MKVTPEKSYVLKTRWLGLSTGVSIAWTESLPFGLIQLLIPLDDDQDLALRDEETLRRIAVDIAIKRDLSKQ